VYCKQIRLINGTSEAPDIQIKRIDLKYIIHIQQQLQLIQKSYTIRLSEQSSLQSESSTTKFNFIIEFSEFSEFKTPMFRD